MDDGGPWAAAPAQRTVKGGDRLCFSIAAASIVAKVARDRMMVELDALYPEYGFASHKGYRSRRHSAALDRHGPCPIHRRSFKPVRENSWEQREADGRPTRPPRQACRCRSLLPEKGMGDERKSLGKAGEDLAERYLKRQRLRRRRTQLPVPSRRDRPHRLRTNARWCSWR